MSELYDNFESRFDYALKGDYKKRFENLQDIDIYGWCKSRELEIELKLHNKGVRSFLAGIFCGASLLYVILIAVGFIAK